METDQCRWVMAVSYPIWASSLSEYTRALGKFCDDELSAKAPESRYLFIPKELCAPAVYELMDYDGCRGLVSLIRSKEAVETNLWEHFTEYALQHNAWEGSGQGGADMLENLLRSLDIPIPEPDDERRETQKAQRVKNCIRYVPELAGQDFLMLPQ